MVAWQYEAIGSDQESVALIAYDEAGMAEAVGSLYEAVAGMKPLMPWKPATSHGVQPAGEGQ
jgi:hypothetical protein